MGELSHVKHLGKFNHLRTLSFQKAGDNSKGSNPICDFVNYTDTIQMYLPHLKELDGQSMDRNSNMVIGSPPKSVQPHSTQALVNAFSNQRSNYTAAAAALSDSPQQHMSAKMQGMQMGQKQHANTTAAIVALQNQASQKETIITKLHEQIRDLTGRLEQTCTERDQTISQFEQNENIWKEKLTRK